MKSFLTKKKRKESKNIIAYYFLSFFLYLNMPPKHSQHKIQSLMTTKSIIISNTMSVYLRMREQHISRQKPLCIKQAHGHGVYTFFFFFFAAMKKLKRMNCKVGMGKGTLLSVCTWLLLCSWLAGCRGWKVVRPITTIQHDCKLFSTNQNYSTWPYALKTDC